MLQTKVTF